MKCRVCRTELNACLPKAGYTAHVNCDPDEEPWEHTTERNEQLVFLPGDEGKHGG